MQESFDANYTIRTLIKLQLRIEFTLESGSPNASGILKDLTPT